MSTRAMIENRLYDALQPSHFELKDDSAKHAGHSALAAKGESHFRLSIVSDAFSGLSQIQRHQLIYKQLQDLMPEPLHALQIKALSPEEQ